MDGHDKVVKLKLKSNLPIVGATVHRTNNKFH